MLLLTLLSFAVFSIIRILFIRQKFFVISYHLLIFIVLFVLGVGGGGVINDNYARLGQFILLEQTGSLEDAKTNPQNYDSMFQIDLEEFKNSEEFKNYIKSHENSVNELEAIIVGLLLLILIETIMFFRKLLLFRKSKKLFPKL